MDDIGKFRVESYLTSRIATIDIGEASKMKHYIHALIEVDVTNVRRFIAD